MSETHPDELDTAIMRELEDDGRRAFRDIARTLGVSEATIRARYRKLTDNGVLRLVTFTDPAATARSRMALLFLRVEPAHHEAVAQRLAARPEVSYVSTVLGHYDLFAQVLVADDSALWHFLQEVVRPTPGVLDVESTTEVAVHKLWFEKGLDATKEAPAAVAPQP